MHDIGNGITVVTGGAGLIGSATIWGINNQNLSNVWLVDWVEKNSLKEENLKNINYTSLYITLWRTALLPFDTTSNIAQVYGLDYKKIVKNNQIKV